MGARRIVDYVFKVSKDDVSPRFKSLNRAQRRFQRSASKSWQGYERTANRSLSNVSRNGQRQFRQLGRAQRDAFSGGLTQAIATAGVGLAIKKSLTDLALLDDQITGIAIKLKQPVESLKAIKQEILDFSRQPGIRESADGLAASVNTLVGADFKLSEAFDIAKASAKGSAVALTQTGFVTKGLTAILKGFKIEGERSEEVISKMLRAADLGTVELEHLAGAMVDVVAPAIQMGASIEEVLALLETLSVSGVANADEGSTSIARMLERFSETDFRKTTQRMGIRVVDESGNLKSPITILDLIQEKFEKLNNDVQRSKFLEKITGGSNVRVKRALLPLLQNMDKVKAAVKDISNSNNRLDEAFTESQKRLSTKFAKFSNDLRAVSTDIATLFVPGIDLFSKFVQENFDPKEGEKTFSDSVREMIRLTAETAEQEGWGLEFWKLVLLDPLKGLGEHLLKNNLATALGALVVTGAGVIGNRGSGGENKNGGTPIEVTIGGQKISLPPRKKNEPSIVEQIRGRLIATAAQAQQQELRREGKQQILFNPKINTVVNLDPATGKTRTQITIDDPTLIQRRVPIGVTP